MTLNENTLQRIANALEGIEKEFVRWNDRKLQPYPSWDLSTHSSDKKDSIEE